MRDEDRMVFAAAETPRGASLHWGGAVGDGKTGFARSAILWGVGVQAVFLPADRVFQDVFPEVGERFIVPDDVIVKSFLPSEVVPAGGPNPTGTGGFELTDDHSQRP